jgi:hypothetical protein
MKSDYEKMKQKNEIRDLENGREVRVYVCSDTITEKRAESIWDWNFVQFALKISSVLQLYIYILQ